MIKLNAKQLRTIKPALHDFEKVKRNPIYLILDDVLDTYNVGAIFRLADAVSASFVYLCGETAIPQDLKVGHKIIKASVGTYKWVPWQYVPTLKEAIGKFKVPFGPRLRRAHSTRSGRGQSSCLRGQAEFKVIAIEQHPKSIPFDKVNYKLPLVLIVGNETYGVNKKVLKMVDQIVEIPMFGVNQSLNVMVSLAIVLYEVVKQNLNVFKEEI